MLSRLLSRFKQRDELSYSAATIAEALRLAARLTQNESAAVEYRASAAALERAVSHVRESGNADLKREIAYVFSRAQTNLHDKLNELADLHKETHLLVQGVQNDTRSAMQKLYDILTALRQDFTQLREEVDDVRQLYADSRADRADLRARLERIEQSLEGRPSAEETARLIAEHREHTRRLLAIEAWLGHVPPAEEAPEGETGDARG